MLLFMATFIFAKPNYFEEVLYEEIITTTWCKNKMFLKKKLQNSHIVIHKIP